MKKNIFFLGVRLSIGLMFIISGAMKIINRSDFIESLAQIPFLNEDYFSIIASTLPLIECVIGIMLLFGVLTQYASLTASVLIILFTAIYTPILIDPTMEAQCACFGVSSEIDGLFLLRNSIIFGLTFSLFTQTNFIFSLDSVRVKS